MNVFMAPFNSLIAEGEGCDGLGETDDSFEGITLFTSRWKGQSQCKSFY